MVDIIDNLALGFSVALSPATLFYCGFGVTVGMFIGVLPGIGTIAALSMLMPVTYHLDLTSALVMLAGIYYGAAYGGSTASILLNLPGSPSSAVTAFDGYPMAKQGRAGLALFLTTIASFVGNSIGVLILLLFAPLFATVALQFGAPEYFGLTLLGLVAAALLSTSGPFRALTMVVLGLLLGTVGADINSGVHRYTFGMTSLLDGVSLVAVAMGLFGIPEVIWRAGRRGEEVGSVPNKITWRSMLPTREDWKRSAMPMLRGGGIGSFFGAVPGVGGSIATFVAYATEKRVSKDPSRFGKGAVEGIASPESANNAAIPTAFIPTLTLGIPGDAIMALMMGVFLIHGIFPGPSLITNDPELFWGLIASFIIGNIFLLILNLPLIGIWLRILLIPYKYLFPAIILFVCIGVYTVNLQVFEVLTVAFFGALGYGMRLLRFEPAPLLLGIVLGPLLEENFRRAMLLSRGDFQIFIQKPISAGLLMGISLLVAVMVYSEIRSRRKRARMDADFLNVDDGR